jgi:hypothetical protein
MKVFWTCILSLILNGLFVVGVSRMNVDHIQDVVLVAWMSVGIPAITWVAFNIVLGIAHWWARRPMWGVKQKNRQLPAGVL